MSCLLRIPSKENHHRPAKSRWGFHATRVQRPLDTSRDCKMLGPFFTELREPRSPSRVQRPSNESRDCKMLGPFFTELREPSSPSRVQRPSDTSRDCKMLGQICTELRELGFASSIQRPSKNHVNPKFDWPEFHSRANDCTRTRNFQSHNFLIGRALTFMDCPAFDPDVLRSSSLQVIPLSSRRQQPASLNSQ